MDAKVIVDASVLLAAYGADGEVRRYWRDSLGACRIIVSPEIFIEVEARLRNGEYNLPDEAITTALSDILSRCEIVRPNPSLDPKFADTGGAHLAALAKYRYPDGTRPRWLLTDDEALLRIASIGPCKIASIGAFCKSVLTAVDDQG